MTVSSHHPLGGENFAELINARSKHLLARPLKTAVPFHNRPLELVACPQCPVIEVAGWLTPPDKFPV